jgi:competence protein ComEA
VEPTATPWRVLEDPAERTAAVVPTANPNAQPSLVSRSTLAIAGGAVSLALLAFFLAFGAGANGTVLLDGGTPLGSAVAQGGFDGTGVVADSSPADLVVEIVGAVVRPGVYRVPPESRIGDLVNAAGGYGARVDADRASRELNLAALLHDGDQVRVPSRDDEANSVEPGQGNGGSAPQGEGGPVDLNQATSAELEALPGIGPVTAGKILTSREEQPFAGVDELRTRKLVGEKTFEAIKDLVVVR